MNIKKTALEFLLDPERLTAVIGSSPLDGNTHTATVYYFVDNEFNFYFLTATGTQKYRNLLENKNAAIVVGFGPSYTTVQGQGVATLLNKDSAEEREAIAHIKHRLLNNGDKTWPIFQIDAFEDQSIAVFRFTPATLQLMNLEQNNGLPITAAETLQIL